MSKRKSARRKAIIRRRIFLLCCVAVIISVVALVVFVAKSVFSGNTPKTDNSSVNSSNTSSSADVSSSNSSLTKPSSSYNSSSDPKTIQMGDWLLDAEYSNLLLVNDKNPLPSDYDYESNLVQIPNELLNNSWFKQEGGYIDKNVLPYIRAMVEAAWSQNVQLFIWSPYRAYSVQQTLFQNQVNKALAKGLSKSAAEAEASTVVARPGTSEHHTGLAADFNMADDKFESTEMYKWLQENAEKFGFVMRYSGKKQDVTGVIHESWHYRFVGINSAKEMNKLGMCLEEYVEYKNK